MNLTIEQFEQIEAYLKGQLSEADAQNFEQELAQNNELRVEVQTQRQLRFGLASLALENRIKAAHTRHISAEKEAVVVPLLPQRSWFSNYWAAAASVVLVVGLALFYQNRYYISDEALAISDQEMSYKALPIEIPKNATEVDKKRRTLQKADWYFALAFIQKGEKQKAKTMLKRMATTEGHLYQAKAKKMLTKL
jgi:hypothetical protein